MEANRNSPTATPETGPLSFEHVPWRSDTLALTRIITATGIALLVLLAQFVFRIGAIGYPWLWGTIAAYATVNLVFWGFSRRGTTEQSPSIAIPTAQTVLDCIALTLLLHFSGGINNPLFLLYPLIVIPAASLLSKRTAWFLAGFALFLFAGMAVLEGLRIIHHYRLVRGTLYNDPVFISTTVIAVSFAVLVTTALISRLAEYLRLFRFQCELSISERSRVEMEKTHFLDVVAHDLKSPLAAIETMVSSILDAYGAEMNEDTRDTLERIPRRTRDVIRFIQNLLDFSRIRSQEGLQGQFRPLNFLPVVTSTVEMYMDQALDKNITITVQAEPNLPTLTGSREHLERMVANLVSNAVRYTQDGGSIKVKLGTSDNDLVLTVADSGIGIPEKEIPRIFDEFYRAGNARTSTSAGTGLGLPIAKFIVEKHGGSISVNSVEGEGTVFTVRLPVVPVKQPA